MAKVHGRNAYLTIDGKNFHQDSNSITLDIVGDTAEYDVFGNWWKRSLPGDIGWTIKGEFFWDIDTNHVDHELWNQWEASEVAMDFRPGGSVVGLYSYTGSVIIGSYSISSPVAGMITGSFSLQGSGQLSRTIIS